MHLLSLSRSATAVAALALTPVTLTAVPAGAAPRDGVTREMVLKAVADHRRARTAQEHYDVEPQLRAISRERCGIGAGALPIFDVSPVAAGQGADGFLLKTTLDTGTATTRTGIRTECVIVAIATTDPAGTLSGRLMIDATATPSSQDPAPLEAPLTGDIFVSDPISVTDGTVISAASFSVRIDSVRRVAEVTTRKVAVPKTSAQKRAARATYDQRMTAAKKRYLKARKGTKAAARRSYARKKASCTLSYRRAIAPTYRYDTITSHRIVNTPLTLGGTYPPAA